MVCNCEVGLNNTFGVAWTVPCEAAGKLVAADPTVKRVGFNGAGLTADSVTCSSHSLDPGHTATSFRDISLVVSPILRLTRGPNLNLERFLTATMTLHRIGHQEMLVTYATPRYGFSKLDNFLVFLGFACELPAKDSSAMLSAWQPFSTTQEATLWHCI